MGVGAVVLATATACSSSTMIHTRPSGASLYIDDEPVGVTPYLMSDTKIVGSTTRIRAELPGYEPLQVAIQRNEKFSVGACIGGVLVLVPFLWIMGYRDSHHYELRPLAGGGWEHQQPPPGTAEPGDQWGAPPSGWDGPTQGYPPPQPPPSQGYPPPRQPYPPPPPPPRR